MPVASLSVLCSFLAPSCYEWSKPEFFVLNSDRFLTWTIIEQLYDRSIIEINDMRIFYLPMLSKVN